jgi:hypothetical protein
MDNGAYSIVVGTEGFASSLSPDYLLKFSSSPNPFSSATRFSYSIPPALAQQGTISYSLHIYSVSGRVVKTIKGVFKRDANAFSTIWDGTDDGGRPLPAGYYMARFRVSLPGSKNITALEKMVKLQ